MRTIRPRIAATLLLLGGIAVAKAQQPTASTAVPRLVRYSGTFHATNGTPTENMESMTLSVYRDQTGGSELWYEIQNVTVDADGHYSVLMGATQNEGMPLDLFASGEPRWLGVRFNRPGETEQPRVLLVSVPYALKASDAETLGGKPASAYLLAPSAATGVGDGSVNSGTSPNAVGTTTPTNANTVMKPRTVSGQINRVAKFVDASNDVGNSSIFDANGLVGISTVAPLISLDVRTGSLPQMGIAGTTDYLTFFASDVFGPAIYWDPAKDMRFGKGGAGLYNPFGFVEQMRIQSSTGNVGIGTMTPASKLDVAGDVNFSGSVRFQGSPVLQFLKGLNDSFSENLGLGIGALQSNAGSNNTALGNEALQRNTTGNSNTAVGIAALFSNTTGVANTATGDGALASNTGGSGNTANGIAALGGNTTGLENTAIGASALGLNATANDNTAVGYQALGSNTTGSVNTAVGDNALSLNTTGTNNIAVGQHAATSVSGGGSNNIHIGNLGSTDDNGVVRIGSPGTQTSFFAAGIRGVTTGANDAIPVVIDSNGQLGTVNSSRRFKEDIEEMGEASHGLMRLRPVTFRYTKPFADGSKPIQYGLIAEEVSDVYPDLVAHSADGQIETVKYQVLDSMLLNEVQRQQAEIRGLEQQNRILKERLDKLEKVLTTMARVSGVSSGQ